MNPRWFIPLFLLGFVILVAGLSMYLTSGEPLPRRDIAAFRSRSTHTTRVSPRERDGRVVRGKLDRSGDTASSSARENRYDVRRIDRRRRGVPLRMLAERLANGLDNGAVRFRSNLADTATVQYLAGIVEMYCGKQLAAIDRFDRILDRRPNNTAALAAKAGAMISVGRFEDAARTYRRLLDVQPNDAAARYNYGVLLCRQSRFGEAADQFRALIHLDPDHAAGLYNLASLAQRAGALGEAREAWEAYTRLRPYSAAGWYNLGVVWMDYDQPLDAAWCFRQAVRLNPGDAPTWLNLGIAYAAADHLYAALDAVNTADDLSPCDPMILRQLAKLHIALAALSTEADEAHRLAASRIREQIASLESAGNEEQTAVVGVRTDGE
ncbi:MAG: tetratricopeptide repeat protein [Planctomycetota bacterium]